MFESRLAPHETLDLHELLASKTVSVTRTSAMLSAVNDPELRAVMEGDIQMCSKHAKDIQSLLNKAL